MRKIIILISILLISSNAYCSKEVFKSQEACEEKMNAKCSVQMCDYVPKGKTFEEVCGKDFKKGWVAYLTEEMLGQCNHNTDCIIVDYAHCCGQSKKAINQLYLDAYQSKPEWQKFDDPQMCASMGVCLDNSNATDTICVKNKDADKGTCEIAYIQ